MGGPERSEGGRGAGGGAAKGEHGAEGGVLSLCVSRPPRHGPKIGEGTIGDQGQPSYSLHNQDLGLLHWRVLLGSLLLAGFAAGHGGAPRGVWLGDSFTVEAWVRLDSLGHCPILYGDLVSTVRLGLSCTYGVRTEPTLYVSWPIPNDPHHYPVNFDNLHDTIVQDHKSPASLTVPLGRWTHVAAVVSGSISDVRFYIDGIDVTAERPPFITRDPAINAVDACLVEREELERSLSAGTPSPPSPCHGDLFCVPGDVGEARISWWPRTARALQAGMGSAGRLAPVPAFGQVETAPAAGAPPPCG